MQYEIKKVTVVMSSNLPCSKCGIRFAKGESYLVGKGEGNHTMRFCLDDAKKMMKEKKREVTELYKAIVERITEEALAEERALADALAGGLNNGK